MFAVFKSDIEPFHTAYAALPIEQHKQVYDRTITKAFYEQAGGVAINGYYSQRSDHNQLHFRRRDNEGDFFVETDNSWLHNHVPFRVTRIWENTGRDATRLREGIRVLEKAAGGHAPCIDDIDDPVWMIADEAKGVTHVTISDALTDAACGLFLGGCLTAFGSLFINDLIDQIPIYLVGGLTLTPSALRILAASLNPRAYQLHKFEKGEVKALQDISLWRKALMIHESVMAEKGASPEK